MDSSRFVRVHGDAPLLAMVLNTSQKAGRNALALMDVTGKELWAYEADTTPVEDDDPEVAAWVASHLFGKSAPAEPEENKRGRLGLPEIPATVPAVFHTAIRDFERGTLSGETLRLFEQAPLRTVKAIYEYEGPYNEGSGYIFKSTNLKKAKRLVLDTPDLVRILRGEQLDLTFEKARATFYIDVPGYLRKQEKLDKDQQARAAGQQAVRARDAQRVKVKEELAPRLVADTDPNLHAYIDTLEAMFRKDGESEDVLERQRPKLRERGRTLLFQLYTHQLAGDAYDLLINTANRSTRAFFQRVTGIALPSTQRGTEEVLRKYEDTDPRSLNPLAQHTWFLGRLLPRLPADADLNAVQTLGSLLYSSAKAETAPSAPTPLEEAWEARWLALTGEAENPRASYALFRPSGSSAPGAVAWEAIQKRTGAIERILTTSDAEGVMRSTYGDLWTIRGPIMKGAPATPAEYRYGAMNRPPGLGASPPGFLRIEPPLSGVGEINERMTRHGVIVYPRPLTAQEVKDWELYTYMPADEIMRRAVEASIEAGYGVDYGDYIRKHGPDDEQAQQQIWDSIRDMRVYTDQPWQPITRAVLVELARRFPAAATPAPAALPAPAPRPVLDMGGWPKVSRGKPAPVTLQALHDAPVGSIFALVPAKPYTMDTWSFFIVREGGYVFRPAVTTGGQGFPTTRYAQMIAAYDPPVTLYLVQKGNGSLPSQTAVTGLVEAAMTALSSATPAPTAPAAPAPRAEVYPPGVKEAQERWLKDAIRQERDYFRTRGIAYRERSWVTDAKYAIEHDDLVKAREIQHAFAAGSFGYKPTAFPPPRVEVPEPVLPPDPFEAASRVGRPGNYQPLAALYVGKDQVESIAKQLDTCAPDGVAARMILSAWEEAPMMQAEAGRRGAGRPSIQEIARSLGYTATAPVVQPGAPVGYVYAVEGKPAGKGETGVLHVWPISVPGEQTTPAFTEPVTALPNRRGYGAILVDPKRTYVEEIELTREEWNRTRKPKIREGAFVQHPSPGVRISVLPLVDALRAHPEIRQLHLEESSALEGYMRTPDARDVAAVALVGARAVGLAVLAAVRPGRYDVDDGTLGEFNVFIQPEQRRKGIARRLFEAILPRSPFPRIAYYGAVDYVGQLFQPLPDASDTLSDDLLDGGWLAAHVRPVAPVVAPRTAKMPKGWAEMRDPDHRASGSCCVCGREAGGANYVKVDLEDNSILDVNGEQRLPVGKKCQLRVPAQFLTNPPKGPTARPRTSPPTARPRTPAPAPVLTLEEAKAMILAKASSVKLRGPEGVSLANYVQMGLEAPLSAHAAAMVILKGHLKDPAEKQMCERVYGVVQAAMQGAREPMLAERPIIYNATTSGTRKLKGGGSYVWKPTGLEVTTGKSLALAAALRGSGPVNLRGIARYRDVNVGDFTIIVDPGRLSAFARGMNHYGFEELATAIEQLRPLWITQAAATVAEPVVSTPQAGTVPVEGTRWEWDPAQKIVKLFTRQRSYDVAKQIGGAARYTASAGVYYVEIPTNATLGTTLASIAAQYPITGAAMQAHVPVWQAR